MIVVNTETIPGYTIHEVKGLVQGNTIRAKHLGREPRKLTIITIHNLSHPLLNTFADLRILPLFRPMALMSRAVCLYACGVFRSQKTSSLYP